MMKTIEKEIFLRRILDLPPVSPSIEIPAPILRDNSLDATARNFLPTPSVIVPKKIPVTRQSSPRSASTTAEKSPHPSKIISPPKTPPHIPNSTKSTRPPKDSSTNFQPLPSPRHLHPPPFQPTPPPGPYFPLHSPPLHVPTPPNQHPSIYSPTGYQNMGGQYFSPSPNIPTNSPSPSMPSFPIFPHAPNKILQLLQVYNNLFYSLSSMLMSSIPACSAPQNYSPYQSHGYSPYLF